MDNTDVHAFLNDLAQTTATAMSGKGSQVCCGVTVTRHKKPVAVASTNARARKLDDLQNAAGVGPCLTALHQNTMIHVPEVGNDHRWPAYMKAAAAAGIGSILAVPVDLQQGAEAVLNLYSPQVHGFSHQNIVNAENIAVTAAKALRLALKIAHLSDARDNLAAALESRTTIDTAIGVIMAQNRCSRDAAFQILVSASSHRNVKLRALAAKIIASVSGENGLTTIYEE